MHNTLKKLIHEYKFGNGDHNIRTPFAVSEKQVKHTVVEESSDQTSILHEYDNGFCVLQIAHLKTGATTYKTNYPLVQISKNVFDVKLP